MFAVGEWTGSKETDQLIEGLLVKHEGPVSKGGKQRAKRRKKKFKQREEKYKQAAPTTEMEELKALQGAKIEKDRGEMKLKNRNKNVKKLDSEIEHPERNTKIGENLVVESRIKKRKMQKNYNEDGVKNAGDDTKVNVNTQMKKKKRKKRRIDNTKDTGPPETGYTGEQCNEVKVSKKSKKNKYKHLAGKPRLIGGQQQLKKVQERCKGNDKGVTVNEVHNDGAKSIEETKKLNENKKIEKNQGKKRKIENTGRVNKGPSNESYNEVIDSKKSKKNKYNTTLEQQKFLKGMSLKSESTDKIENSKPTNANKHLENKNIKNRKGNTEMINSKKKLYKDKKKDIKLTGRGTKATARDEEETSESEDDEEIDDANIKKSPKAAQTLKEKMQDRLKYGRFRFLNEQLYTCTGEEAYKAFSQDKDAYRCYHDGFQNQVQKWPQNPVNRVIKYIKKRPPMTVVADFGCGNAKIARAVPHKVHSFDLVPLNKHVTPCNMANVPLGDGSVDVAVFCLSLMGTNLLDFLTEAHRVLRHKGTLLIAEVVSRFDKIGDFIRKLGKIGFELANKDPSNKMFVWLEFEKERDPIERLPTITLKPCLYKKR